MGWFEFYREYRCGFGIFVEFQVVVDEEIICSGVDGEFVFINCYGMQNLILMNVIMVFCRVFKGDGMISSVDSKIR